MRFLLKEEGRRLKLKKWLFFFENWPFFGQEKYSEKLTKATSPIWVFCTLCVCVHFYLYRELLNPRHGDLHGEPHVLHVEAVAAVGIGIGGGGGGLVLLALHVLLLSAILSGLHMWGSN